MKTYLDNTEIPKWIKKNLPAPPDDYLPTTPDDPVGYVQGEYRLLLACLVSRIYESALLERPPIALLSAVIDSDFVQDEDGKIIWSGGDGAEADNDSIKQALRNWMTHCITHFFENQ